MNNGITRRGFVKTAALGGAGMISLGMQANEIKDTMLHNTPDKSLIIDSHCHAWDYWPYTPAVPDPESHGKVEQLIHQMDLHGVDQATIVTAEVDHNPANNEYVANVVSKYKNRLHQFADIDSVWSATYHKPGAAKRMETAINKYNPKGLTHYLSESDDAEWLNTSDGIDFLSVASQSKLIFSIACAPNHQPALRKVAERFPDMPVLCHHMSGLKASGSAARKNLQEVLTSAVLPNIYLKLSGFAYVSDDDKKFEYPYKDTQWIYKACYEKYGRRMVWGSDYPVVNFYMTYQQSLEAFRKHCAFVSEADKAAILGGTLNGLLQEN